jgi:hypothetical protein
MMDMNAAHKRPHTRRGNPSASRQAHVVLNTAVLGNDWRSNHWRAIRLPDDAADHKRATCRGAKSAVLVERLSALVGSRRSAMALEQLSDGAWLSWRGANRR